MLFQSFAKKLITKALFLEARLVLRKYKPRIIAVTGSVGKTGTKDAIFTVLSQKIYTEKSTKSYNSEIGIPLAILGRETGWGSVRAWVGNLLHGMNLILTKHHYPLWLILEAGIDRPGDMKKITSLIQPDIVVLTHFPETPPHVEFFSSKEALFQEKWLLAKALKKGGVIIANGDDALIKEFLHHTDARVITYGFSEGVSIRGSNEHILYGIKKENGRPVGITCKIDYDGKSMPIEILGTLGEGYVYSALAAIAVGTVLGGNLVEMREALSLFETPPGRMKILSGKEGSVIIDDTYNSSPEALKLALSALSHISGVDRKIAVLGDMLELGKLTVPAHKEAGEHAAKSGVDFLVSVGLRARSIADGANGAGMKKSAIKSFNNAEEAGRFLSARLTKGDAVLVKGSQGIRLEKAVKMLLANPEEAGNLLVRQEPEWRNR